MKQDWKHKRWKKRHDYKSMLRKVHFRKKKSADRRLGRPRYEAKMGKDINYKIIDAPSNFSLINNEEEVLGFIDKVKSHYKAREPVYINLDKVNTLGNGAILLLLANMFQFRSHGVPFNGSKPDDPALRKKLEESGFFKHLYKSIAKQDDYNVGSPDGMIYTHAQKEVDSALADLVIENASKTVWGVSRRCPGIQRTLVELMHNTNNHAGHAKGTKHWWLSSSKDEINKTVTLTFLDFGRGIFDSLDNKKTDDIFYGWKDIFFKVFPWADTSEKVLKLILEGQLHKTCTKQYFRGKGLPGIYDAFQSGRIGKLLIISNRVYADIETNTYKLLKHNMHGTFVSCEINENIKNLPW